MKLKIILTTLIITFMVSVKFMISKNKPVATFGVTQIAFSSDPLDYDYTAHHLAFASIFAKLISTEKNGTIFPMLAASWSNKNNFKEWHFKIKNNLTYSNGDKITIEDIKLNFKRLIYLKNKNNSLSGVLEFLNGFSDFKKISDELPGLSISGDELVFVFDKPMPDLLELISFGFYGLAHPSLYDQNTGLWLDKTKVISSGPYSVKKWNNESFEITLRDNVSFSDKENRLKEIHFVIFTKFKNAEELNNVDFLIADKHSLLVSDEFEYVGSAVKLKIGYVNVFSALKKNSAFSRLEVRKWFRHKFYQGLEKNNFPTTNSFFPLTLKGITSLKFDHSAVKPVFESFIITSDPIIPTVKLEENKDKKGTADFFLDGMNELGIDSGASILLEERADQIYDLEILGTGIESNNYWDTVKFMFLSKEGIRLPDISGKIIEELKKETPNINIVNQELWDQAIIWPVRHYTTGYWFNKKSRIDYSEVNFNSPSVDFQFFKWQD